ncbi:hypothetical protein ACFU44_13760 [Nocardia rhizosphaerihabitans]|uniref:phage adaptor protein n=1 Tax=Nocardia rhizosphaerihabitans TaxID=1691570 RepID=UPI00366D28C6
MAYNLGTLISEIRTRSKDSSLSDAMITYFVQEVQDEVLGHHSFPFMETSRTDTLSIGATSYAYQTNHQAILGVRLTDAVDVYGYCEPVYMPYRQFDDRYPTPNALTAGRPLNFTDYGRVLYWSCPLDKAYTLRFRFQRASVELASSSTVPDIPVEFKQLLVKAGLAGVEEHRENFDIAALHKRKVEDLTEDLLRRYSTRQLMKAPKATIPRRTSRDMWGE